VRAIAARATAQDPRELCHACFEKARARECGICGRIRPVKRKAADGKPDICGACAQRLAPLAVCSLRGQQKPGMFPDGAGPVCQRCRALTYYARHPCTACGEHRRAVWRTPIVAVCERCYRAHLNAKAVCDRCGQLRRPATLDAATVLCAECAGIEPHHVCRLCGDEDERFADGICTRCHLRRQIDAFAAGGVPGAVVRLRPYLDALIASPRPRSVLLWLSQSPAAGVLGELISGRLELSHEALDQREHPKADDAIKFLRAALVEHGVLEARAEKLARVQRWAQEQLEALPDSDDRALLRSYARWKLLRDLAQRAQDDLDANTAAHARARLRHAIKLTTWLHEQDRTLADLRQDLLERWLLDGPSPHRRIAEFIRWLQKTNVIAGVQMPGLAPRSPTLTVIKDSKRWALLRRLLDDDRLDLRYRVAGSLLLLYAQPISRIAGLRREHVILNADYQVLIVLGQEPIPMPTPLARLTLRLRDAPTALVTTAATKPSPWLLPGRKLGRPITPQALAQRLHALGIPAIAARSSALAHLLHTVPPAVLAQLIGISAQSAERYSAALRADYSRYVSLRAGEPHSGSRHQVIASR
jgi:hypothetical protein